MTDTLSPTLLQWNQIVMRHAMKRMIFYAKQNNYSMEMLNVMMRLHYRGACGVGDLGGEMGVSSAAASQLLDKMVQQGLALRIEDPQDRRNKRISLTEQGAEVVQKAIEARQAWMGPLVAELAPEQQEEIRRALNVLIEKSSILDQPQG